MLPHPPRFRSNPAEGWHCSHLYYRFDRARLASTHRGRIGRRAPNNSAATLDPAGPQAPARLQTSVVSGHKADFGLMLLDADPLVIDARASAADVRPAGPGARADLFVRLADRSFRIRAHGRAIRQAAGRRRRRPDRPGLSGQAQGL